MIAMQRKTGERRLKHWDNAAARFFQLMVATAQTKEVRAVYTSFLNKERRLLSEYGLTANSQTSMESGGE